MACVIDLDRRPARVMAFGFADDDAPINVWRSPREPLLVFASFQNFEN